ncbi:MAG: 3'(2'),5'-bisphosphate nucleotidase CysQ [Gammaproteobacteria bacterium]|nr:3'(2'),5'-bisphosphate nucleotidase CysQ [Gammaproteobacteria bacterium]
MNADSLLGEAVRIAERAGRAIRDAGPGMVRAKADGSPLAEADQAAHRVIAGALAKLTPHIPLLSEESPAEVFSLRRAWKKFWLVDPLDGTLEFLAGRDEFTVNIALVENSAPVMGVVHAPRPGQTYFARNDGGVRRAFVREENKKPRILSVNKKDSAAVTVLLSRSRHNRAAQDFVRNLKTQFTEVREVALGSSLKFCRIADGTAHVYPRLGPTSEWDTAAAQCILESAGGSVTTLTGAPLRYNKESLQNPSFIAAAAGRWRHFCAR